jgi:hypothetical protein
MPVRADRSLSRHLLEKYLDSEEAGGDDFKMYYKLANLDDRIKNADQVGLGASARMCGTKLTAVPHRRRAAVQQQARRDLQQHRQARP